MCIVEARMRLVYILGLAWMSDAFLGSSQSSRRIRREAILTVGEPLAWEEAVESGVLEYVREHGVIQFINLWKECCQLRRNDELLWGDELEYAILKVGTDGKTRISLNGPGIVDALAKKEEAHSHRYDGCQWHPEYGAWMVEGTPARPYSGYAADLCRVERNMRQRRRRLLSALEADEICPTMVNFPGLGASSKFWVEHDTGGTGISPKYEVTQSENMPDCVINPHPRFAALTANIRKRRGSKVEARPPRFIDKETSKSASRYIEGLDAMAYGMGSCCLQVTFQARDAREARYLYDQLAALAPVMLALTAGAPIWRGVLADIDARWDIVAASVDDRTPAERGEYGDIGLDSLKDPRLAGQGIRHLSRSRYSSISRYAFECGGGREEEDNKETDLFQTHVNLLSDGPAPLDDSALRLLLDAGVDPALAKHVAALFARDPLVVFRGRIKEIDDHTQTDHFDNLQSTNWNTVRLKPPPFAAASNGENSPGWRTEFRPMEVQLTDFENAAFAVFSLLISRVVLAFDLNLYLPISRLDANMRRAVKRDAATKAKFWFRSHVAPDDEDAANSTMDSPGFYDACCANPFDEKASLFEEMSCAEIIDGKGSYFPGLAPLAYAYLEHIGCDGDSWKIISRYIEHVRRRARGEVKTPAKWIRDFVRHHPDYKHDSLVPDSIITDLSQACHDIGTGARPAPDLLGDVSIRPITTDGAWDIQLSGLAIPKNPERAALIQRYTKRAPFQGYVEHPPPPPGF